MYVLKAVHFTLKGMVQGVGMRPYIATLATKCDLKGYVRNTAYGVEAQLEGSHEAIEDFFETFVLHMPLLARIDGMTQTIVTPKGYTSFSIDTSVVMEGQTMLALDAAPCQECLKELHDPSNRRYGYAFINCTHCGPRYSIIEALPYDRSSTAMNVFAMCHECYLEYHDPSNRRYHAQPIGCHHCGPRYLQSIEDSIKALQAGSVVAVKGVGGFHFLGDATNDHTVKTIRALKNRPFKPLGILCKDIPMVLRYAHVTPKEEALLTSLARPMVLLDKKKHKLSKALTYELQTLGVMLAYTPLHALLFDAISVPLVATSANPSGEPIATSAEALKAYFGTAIEVILDHDRDIVAACDDSVVSSQCVIRLGRGLAPFSKPLLPPKEGAILAVGAHQKNAFALYVGGHIILAPHIGDMDTLAMHEAFAKTLDHFLALYDVRLTAIVCDHHPNYATTLWAQDYAKTHRIELIYIAHHHAHALACMAEYDLTQEVAAFCFDGSGYGSDGTIWGGELLVADQRSFKRKGHIRPFKLLGGAQAIKEPRRVALALLFECYSFQTVCALALPVVQSFTPTELQLLYAMWNSDTNTPITTSMGRMFDAVASLLDMVQVLAFEAQSGMRLESLYEAGHAPYDYGTKPFVFDWEPMIRAMVATAQDKAHASRFIETIVSYVVNNAKLLSPLPVVLTGGVFQNRALLMRTTQALTQAGMTYYVQQATPLNDASIALGQLYGALFNLPQSTL